MMRPERRSSLDASIRYQWEAEVLADDDLATWFFDLCNGREPSVTISSALLAALERHGLIRHGRLGWALAPDGREFARTLGMLGGPSPIEERRISVEATPENLAEREVHNSADNEEMAAAFCQYRKTGSKEIRNRLLEYYLPIVRYTAEKLHQKLPGEIDVDDLISSGIFGLMDAVEAFDISRGVKFETYCAQRIRNAILDELRTLDWVPRVVRSRATKLSAAQSKLEAQLGRKPTNKELAKQLGLSMQEFRNLQRDANAASFVSLSHNSFDASSSKDVREIDFLEERRSPNAFRAVQREDLKEFITHGLSRAERLIVILYYFEEMTMKEIAEHLEMSESRVSQMHSAIMAKLAEQIRSSEREAERS